MKKTILFAAIAFTMGTAAAAPPPVITETMEGYVCTVSRASLIGGRRGNETALAFTLTTEPGCEGAWLDTNYACGSWPSADLNHVFCSKSVVFSMAEQAMMHDELLHAAERNLPVDAGRGPCLSEDPTRTCFVNLTIYNMPREAHERGLNSQSGAK